MDTSTNEHIFNLMQNVVDKLEEVSDKMEIDFNNKSQLETSKKLTNKIENIITQQTNILNNINDFRKKVKKLETSDEHSIVTNNYKYILFGKDSSRNTRFVLIIISIIIISWFAIKYLPLYFLEQSELKNQKENYQLIYNYIYLKQFELKNKTPVELENLFDKIKNKDREVIEEYNILSKKYKKEIQRQELEKKLKKLK